MPNSICWETETEREREASIHSLSSEQMHLVISEMAQMAGGIQLKGKETNNDQSQAFLDRGS